MQLSGPWDLAQIRHFLDQATIPVRLAVNGAQGLPVLASLWFLRDGDLLRCATSPRARIVALLRADPRCGFEVAPERPPYCGVRGQATAERSGDGGRGLLERLLARYEIPPAGRLGRWLLGRADEEAVIALTPTRLMSWDYRARMGDG